jgi:hypothetical protein
MNIGYFTWRPIHITLILRWILRRIRNVSDKSRRENQKAHFIFNIFFFRNRVFYEIMWKIWYNQTGHRLRMRLECCITKTKNTHSEYAILISFPRQQWLRPVASVLHTRTLPLLFSYTLSQMTHHPSKIVVHLTSVFLSVVSFWLHFLPRFPLFLYTHRRLSSRNLSTVLWFFSSVTGIERLWQFSFRATTFAVNLSVLLLLYIRDLDEPCEVTVSLLSHNFENPIKNVVGKVRRCSAYWSGVTPIFTFNKLSHYLRTIPAKLSSSCLSFLIRY